MSWVCCLGGKNALCKLESAFLPKENSMKWWLWSFQAKNPNQNKKTYANVVVGGALRGPKSTVRLYWESAPWGQTEVGLLQKHTGLEGGWGVVGGFFLVIALCASWAQQSVSFVFSSCIPPPPSTRPGPMLGGLSRHSYESFTTPQLLLLQLPLGGTGFFAIFRGRNVTEVKFSQMGCQPENREFYK